MHGCKEKFSVNQNFLNHNSSISGQYNLISCDFKNESCLPPAISRDAFTYSTAPKPPEVNWGLTGQLVSVAASGLA